MPSVETVLTVILVAITLNLVLAVAILVSRRRVDANGRSSPVGPTAVRSPAPESGVPGFAVRTQGLHAADAQTGLELPATWERWLTEEDARVKRYRRPATVVIVELSDLDRLVERLGPSAAERLIPPVATTLRRHGRAADRIARLDRARFGIILVETGEVEAINYIERVRSAADLWLASGAVALRLSIGWAEANASRSTQRAAEVAQERLDVDRHHEPASPSNPSNHFRGEAPLSEPALG